MSAVETPEGEKKEAPAKGGGAKAIIGIVLPALLAAGGGFGGAKLASKGGAHAPDPHAPATTIVHGPELPGPTFALEPFVVNVTDSTTRKSHPMRVTISIELRPGVKEDDYKPFMPRIRDATLSYLRSMSYEDANDGSKLEKTRTELLEQIRKAGLPAAQKILITDFVVS